MSREHLSAQHRGCAPSCSLPPCGGGSGRGVAPNRDLSCDTPLPSMLRIADLSHKGRGNKNECPS
jgi:hypothetical protein